jgi:GntR family transcriptional regulator
LDPKSSVPLYLQLREALLNRITHGKIAPHEKLPSERELVREFGISRMTVRRAVQDLIQEGLLYTRVGKGTFVSSLRFEQDHLLTGFTEEMRGLDRNVSSEVLAMDLILADEMLVDKLELDPNSPVHRLHRLRKADDIPLASEIAHIPQELCPTLDQYNFASESLYATMGRVFGVRLVSAKQTVVASLANAAEHRIFNTTHPAAVLRMQRTTRTEKNVIAEYVESVYRGDLYKLSARLVADRN